MMMSEPENNLFKELLSDYAAPVADNGFTDALMQEIQLRQQKRERLRRSLLGTAFFVGGIIAATQVPNLVNLLAQYSPSLPELKTGELMTTAKTSPLWSLLGVTVFGFVLWSLLDNRDASIF